VPRISLYVFIAIAAGAVLWAVFGGKSSKINGEPPLSGWMENFVPVAERSEPVPLTLQKQDNSSVALDDWRGKIVLLNFWATWCSPCIREMPSILRLSEKLGGDDFAVIALSQDIRGWEKIAPFLAKHDLAGLPVYADPGIKGTRLFRVKAMPTTILLDRKGREIGRLAGHAEWDSGEALALIRHYLAE